VLTTTARRTQAERRTSTRHSLLSAATAILVERGLTATTTTEVARVAGLSQGALFKHFASKAELLAAVAAHLHEELLGAYLDRFHRLNRTNDVGDRLDKALRLLWQLFQTDEMAAALELEMNARTDTHLRHSLLPIAERHASRIRAVAVDLFPDHASTPTFARMFDLVLETMHGMALSRCLAPNPAHERALLAHLQMLARAGLTETGAT